MVFLRKIKIILFYDYWESNSGGRESSNSGDHGNCDGLLPPLGGRIKRSPYDSQYVNPGNQVFD